MLSYRFQKSLEFFQIRACIWERAHSPTQYFLRISKKMCNNQRNKVRAPPGFAQSFESTIDSIVSHESRLNGATYYSSIPGHGNHRNDPGSVFLS